MTIVCWAFFSGILRTGEAVSLRRSHIAVSPVKAVFTFENSKGKSRFGDVEGSEADDPEFLLHLEAYLNQLQASDLLLRRSAVEFRAVFKRAMTELGLQEFGFQPYSLRRGGATADFLRHGKMDVTADKGRWKDRRTARIYVNTAVAARTELRFRADQERKLQEFAQVLTHVSQVEDKVFILMGYLFS